jgi:hypothetical protein
MRREFITLFGCAVAAPLATRGQRRTLVFGYLGGESLRAVSVRSGP